MAIRHGSEREKLYLEVARCVGNTNLYEIKNIRVPNGCRVFCKEEYLNPTGSHYDRFWVDYLRREEDSGLISTSDTLIETSTGNSGASFAWACRALGFMDYHVVIPEDMPYTRIRQIEELGAIIKCSPKGIYVDGLIATFIAYANEVEKNSNKRVFRTNHAIKGDISLASLGAIATEVIKKLSASNIKLDYFISALGNGLSTRGIGETLKQKYPTIKIIGFEAEDSPTVYSKLNPEMIRPDTTGRTHGLLGTSPGGDPSRFPIMDGYSKHLFKVELVKEKEWTDAGIMLANREGKLVGHTSSAAFFEAMKLAQGVSNKNILIIFYDPSWKYF